MRSSSSPRAASSTNATRRPRRSRPDDRRVVADVGRDAEDDDLGRVERLEHGLRVRVREHVEALLQEQDLATPRDELARRRPAGRRRGESGSGSACSVSGILLRAARAPKAVRRIRAREVRGCRDLGVGELVVVGRGDVHDAVARGPSATSRAIAGTAASAPGTASFRPGARSRPACRRPRGSGATGHARAGGSGAGGGRPWRSAGRRRRRCRP